ncbi:MAG: DUF938 domain-containing protein [Hyphomicrobiales bacterium]
MVIFVSDYSKLKGNATEDGRFRSPAFERNHQPIVEALRARLNLDEGHVLELGSGPGQHISVLGKAFPELTFWPSDPYPAHRESVEKWSAHHGVSNVNAPFELDASEPWDLEGEGKPPSGALQAVLCINVLHVAPWHVAQGVLKGASDHLADDGALFLYGPYSVDGEHISDGNADFDAAIRTENADWGVRDTREMAEEAATHGLVIAEIVEMPSNNFILVAKRG